MTESKPVKFSFPWIGKPWMDTLFILFPPFACLLFIVLCPHLFRNSKEVPDVWWVVLILLVDVAHVYSTLYRTYFDKQAFDKQRSLLVAIPFVGFVAGVILFSVSSLLFWRVLAYVAVFHFIRQQYGFMRVYSRHENNYPMAKIIDTIAIYYATIYPIVYWHLATPRNFNWFVEGDFLYYRFDTLLLIATALYYIVLATYIGKEIWMVAYRRQINLPRIAIIAGTILSWYFGIIYFNGDLAFTLLNVVSHGIPYMALIYIYGKKNHNPHNSKSGIILQKIFSRYGVLVFLAIIFLFAYLEEGLWDFLVWQDHKSIFSAFYIADFKGSHQLLSFIVPLLALPQITHYIIDGFIWKIKNDKFKWNNEVAKPSIS